MTLKSRIMNREDLTGLWQVLPGASAAEIAGQARFDFLVLDGEHGPWDPTDLRNRLIASATECVIRVPANEPWLIKQALDLGARTVLVPMVNSVEDARNAVAAAKYPPDGIRGNGAYVARAADYGQDATYVSAANAQTSVWVQAESRVALDQLEDIAAIDGIDCIFLGPADLAADMGHTTDPGHDDVQTAIEDAIARIAAIGVSCGAFGPPALMAPWRRLGCNVLSAGADGTTLAAALAALPR